ncbi:type VI secretion system secreted protein Hcp [Pseudomonas taetrolens]|uniref:Type VI secretion protein n=1 Tax=Pseudomonas taetrolens TaxID=47884 RepID=A0A0J6JNV5_PSETA|nr:MULTISPECIES: Hcp family type VI secretion system effector [Pseudomonas]KMM85492.1 type VI secretion protein [Pseudomonas taetrolens]MBW0236320.1 type VI secretion protein [Pseudomonas sp. D1HM]SEC26039.1 type VI secretion system secreted protein Hcp [Pseudomonas taetrolens]SQF86238.1 type VI secretion system effector, Hcp family [Pseudomonas taetrolens]VEH49314.1 type VI secretion system effector, Hcp family [Pseudomonas taetrolens]
MPTPAYLKIIGVTQGLISSGALARESVGNAWQQGREDEILVQALSHGIVVPGGAQSGQRMHKPLIITKVIDKSSPLINTALCTGEELTLCEVKWYRTSGSATQEHFYTMRLKRAVIIGVDLSMPHCQNMETAHFTQLETVHFAYESITWQHEIAGTSGWDIWQGERLG